METTKIHILLEKVFNYDGIENTDSYIDGVYKTKNKAIEAMEREIQHNIENYNFIEDTDNKIMENKKILFYDYQENWQNYIEFEIIEKEVL